MKEDGIDYLDIYYKLALARRFEEKAGQLYQQGKIGGFCHLYIGQEAVAVGAISVLRPDDYVISAYREHVHCLMTGTDAKKIFAELVGGSSGISRGRGGSMHLFDREHNFMGGHAIVGGQMPPAAGLGYAINYRGGDQVVLCFVGDGTVNIGAFHESLNVIDLWNLPVVVIVENNQYGMGTPVSKASALLDIFQRACSYGIYGKFVDGMDVLAVREVVEKAVSLARLRKRATLIEAKTYRYRGHSMSDPALYRTKEELKEYKERDPLLHFKHYLLEHELIDEKKEKKILDRVKKEIDDAADFALADGEPPPAGLYEDVYAE